MGHRALLLATLAALALGYGLTRHVGILVTAMPSAGEPGAGKQEASPDTGARHWVAGSRSSQRIAFAEHRPMSSALEDVDWPGLPMSLDIESEGPPIEVGEPLPVDDEWGAELALKPEEPIDIGVELDAADPRAWVLEAQPEPAVDIGAPLDPDDHEALDSGVAAEEPMEIGADLDAEDPAGWEPSDAAGAPVDIGDVLDAGAPRGR